MMCFLFQTTWFMKKSMWFKEENDVLFSLNNVVFLLSNVLFLSNNIVFSLNDIVFISNDVMRKELLVKWCKMYVCHSVIDVLGAAKSARGNLVARSVHRIYQGGDAFLVARRKVRNFFSQPPRIRRTAQRLRARYQIFHRHIQGFCNFYRNIRRRNRRIFLEIIAYATRLKPRTRRQFFDHQSLIRKFFLQVFFERHTIRCTIIYVFSLDRVVNLLL